MPPEGITFTISRALDVMQSPLKSLPLQAEPSDGADDDVPTWESMERTRQKELQPLGPAGLREAREFLGRLGSVLENELISLLHRAPADRMCMRYRRCRELGLP